MTKVRKGVTRWFDATPKDGTTLELFCFDFAENPQLRFGIYDQDQDDEKPFDDNVDVGKRGVGDIVRGLNANGKADVLLASNGLFYSGGAVAHHIGPVVLDGKARYNVGSHRWTFGVQYVNGKPEFKTLLQPNKTALEHEFAFAADGAQCLIKDGKPLKLPAFPKPGDPPLPRPIPCSSDEVGSIPDIDFLKTTRVSLGWSRDSSKLYMLFVKEPDSETESMSEERLGEPQKGGWTLEDLQQFWRQVGVWGAINSDAGDIAQWIYLRKDDLYELSPPQIVSSKKLIVDRKLRGVPPGGTLLFFYIFAKP